MAGWKNTACRKRYFTAVEKVLGLKADFDDRRKQIKFDRCPWSWRVILQIIGLSVSIGIFPVLPQSALGSDFDGKSLILALRVTHQHLSRQGSGLVERFEKCPGDDQTEWGFQFIRSVDMKPVDGVRTVVLVDTNQCSGGNENGQYLVIASASSARLILTDTIGDMRFLITRYHLLDGKILQLEGVRWKENDPHCCPSQKGTLSYSIDTGITKYQPN